MSEDLISREKAYKVLAEYYHHKTEMQHKALREALDRVPSATHSNDSNALNALDCVSRKAAVETAQRMYERCDTGDIIDYRDLVVESLKVLPTADIDLSDYSDRLWRNAYERGKADAEPRWIPVTERLPDKMGTYLVTLDYKEHGTGVMSLWFHNEEIGWDLRVADEVTAWMPLPECYRGDGNGE